MKKLLMFITVVVFAFGNSVFSYATNDVFDLERADASELIKDVIECIDTENVEEYIKLFDLNNQENMNDYIKYHGKENFFQEQSVELIDMKLLTYQTGISAANVRESELESYDDILVYYTKEKVVAKAAADRVSSGIKYKVYVVGVNDDSSSLLRFSELKNDAVYNAGEDFESNEAERPVNSGSMQNRAALYGPTTIRVLFENEVANTKQLVLQSTLKTYCQLSGRYQIIA